MGLTSRTKNLKRIGPKWYKISQIIAFSPETGYSVILKEPISIYCSWKVDLPAILTLLGLLGVSKTNKSELQVRLPMPNPADMNMDARASRLGSQYENREIYRNVYFIKIVFFTPGVTQQQL